MSNLGVLEDKLAFLRGFYDLTTEPFREIKRKIDAKEDPYVARGNPEDYDEPAFLSEWLEADEGLKLQQQVCLTLLQRSFREFLDATVQNHRDFPKSKPPRNGNWFENYKAWLYREAAIDWEKAPVLLGRLEELSLARNCVQHGGEKLGIGPKEVFDIHTLLKRQSKDYHARFPDGFFADEFEKRIWREENYPHPVTIELTLEKLKVAIEEILAFAKYIEANLPAWMY